MAKLSIQAGTTSKTIKVFVQNNSVTTGAGLTGLVYNTSSLSAYYVREGASSSTSITLATATLGTWATGGFIVVDGTNMPGLYELGLPNTAIASGAASVSVYLFGATNMAPCLLEIELTAVNNQSTGFGLSNVSSNVVQINGQTASAAGTVTFPGTIASTTNITGGTITTVTNLTNAPTAGDFTSTMKTSITAAVPTTTSITSAILTTQMTESYAALNTVPTLAQILFEQRAILAQNSVTGTTMTVTKIDGATTAETFTLNSSTSPTAITRAT